MDDQGRVYVTDYGLGRVEIYTGEGVYLGRLGHKAPAQASSRRLWRLRWEGTDGFM